MKTKLKKISIIGVGLIGGSLGMALRNKYIITGIGRDEKKLLLAKKLGAVDFFSMDLEQGCKDADIVVICTPVDSISVTIKEILPFIKPGAIITDAGSIKNRINSEVKQIFAQKKYKNYDKPVFVGAHPMAGSEKKGVSAAAAGLYSGAAVILTPEKDTPVSAVEKVKKMWLQTGANVIALSALEHDKIVSVTSHLPHILAFNLCLAAGKINNNAVQKIIAGSFKDMTRIADSDPRDWAAICRGNKKELADVIDKFIVQLNKTKKVLNDINKLEKIFSAGKNAHNKFFMENSKNLKGKS